MVQFPRVVTLATPAGSLRPSVVPHALDGGDVVLWGFLVRGIGFRYRVALLSGFGLVSLLLQQIDRSKIDILLD